MPRLVPVETGETDHLDAIIKGKHVAVRARLRLLKPGLDARYDEYARTAGAYESLTASTLVGTAADDCVGCYVLCRKPVAELKQAVLDARPRNRRSLCQWCLIDTWSDLDHFVPKESFPEFSVMARNLVPCCSKCNKAKGRYWPPTGVVSEVLSLYYSPLLDRPHLAATVMHIPGRQSSIAFSIRHDAGLATTEIATLQAHYNRLKLMRRLRDAGLQKLDVLRESLRAHNVERDRAAEFLRRDATALFAVHGPNYYEGLTALALANVPAALDDYTA